MKNQNLSDLLTELEEAAQELIDFGSSNEKAEGYGMMRVIEEITKITANG
jgi:hypothetical protein